VPLFQFTNVVLNFMFANEVAHFQVVGNMGIFFQRSKANCYRVIFDRVSNRISYFIVEKICKVLIANSFNILLKKNSNF